MDLDRETMLEYLRTSAGLDTEDIEDETLLFSTGILDSFSMMDLMMFIEKEGGFRIQPGDVTFDNLDSVGRILRFAQSQVSC